MSNTVVTPLDERSPSAPVASDRLWQDVAEALRSADITDFRPAELPAAAGVAEPEPTFLARLLDSVHGAIQSLKLSFAYSPTTDVVANPLYLLNVPTFLMPRATRCCSDGPADL